MYRNVTMSYGILLRNTAGQILMIQRRDSVEYIDLIRGRFSGTNRDLEVYLSNMSKDEHIRLQTLNFDQLWDQMWINHSGKIYKQEYLNARRRFSQIVIPDSFMRTEYVENEYLLPRGRKKNCREHTLVCATREFFEETGIRQSEYKIDSNKHHIEYYYGSNGKLYGTKYYVANLLKDTTHLFNPYNMVQCSEVRNMQFFDPIDAYRKVRSYRTSLRQILFEYT